MLFQNSTFNVSKSTLEVMKEEFRLSLSICEEIIAGKVYITIPEKLNTKYCVLNRLFKIFHNYYSFI